MWKRAKIIPITKLGKAHSLDTSKYRPISLIILDGKVLEKLLITRIQHHLYSHNLLNEDQYGFTSQKSTIGAVISLMEHIQEVLETGQVVVLASLDVNSAFDAAWSPSILYALKEYNYPRNLFSVINDYFSKRTASMTIGNQTIEREVTKSCPQGSCCGPGLWNVEYNSVLNLQYNKQTRVIAYADDLILVTKEESRSEAENFMNIEMQKITLWVRKQKNLF